jgi:hypothetical protein
MMLLYREGGRCDAAQAIALLRKSADAGIDLARDALNQTQDRTNAANKGRERPFPCRLPRKAQFIPLGREYSLTGAEAKGPRNGAANRVCRDGSLHSQVASLGRSTAADGLERTLLDVGSWPFSVGDHCQLSGCSLECQVYSGETAPAKGHSHPKRTLEQAAQSSVRARNHRSMISSARSNTDCGIFRPRAFAVFILITSSNFVGCATGRSAGLVPLRILAT